MSDKSQLAILVKESGLEETKANFLLTKFQDYFDITTELNRIQKAYQRKIDLLDDLRVSFPVDVTYVFGDSSKDGISLHLDPIGGQLTAKDTRAVLAWLLENGWGKPGKQLRGDDGEITITSHINIKDDKGEYKVDFFLGGSHPLNCQVKPVVKRVTVFEAVCDGESL